MAHRPGKVGESSPPGLLIGAGRVHGISPLTIEGGELLLSEDFTLAQGVWWHTRVRDRTNIPPRQWGGSYTLKRLTQTSVPVSSQTHTRSFALEFCRAVIPVET